MGTIVDGEQALWRRAVGVATKSVGVAVLLGALVVALIVPHADPLPAGSPAPAITHAHSLDGRVGGIDLAAGKPTVVNFWATWCAPCLQEMPALARISEKYAGQVRFVGLAVDSPRDDVRHTVARFHIPYDVALIDQETVRAWNALSLPSTYVVDRHGRITWSIHGAVDEDILEKHVSPLLAGP